MLRIFLFSSICVNVFFISSSQKSMVSTSLLHNENQVILHVHRCLYSCCQNVFRLQKYFHELHFLCTSSILKIQLRLQADVSSTNCIKHLITTNSITMLIQLPCKLVSAHDDHTVIDNMLRIIQWFLINNGQSIYSEYRTPKVHPRNKKERKPQPLHQQLKR